MLALHVQMQSKTNHWVIHEGVTPFHKTKNLKIHLKEFFQEPANVYFYFNSVKLVEKEVQTMRTCFVSLCLFFSPFTYYL